ncbi:MAG: serine/threonine-protein kinase, partial [Gemmatimonadaceae bacterium]
MGTVYRGWQVNLDREIAIKVIHPKLASDRTAVRRFLRESHLSSRLNQPNIVAVYDFSLHEEQPYLAMEFVRGRSLRQLLDDSPVMDVPDAIAIITQVLDALTAAHEQGVIHRDIKPQNILLQDGHAILADFGIAAALADPGETAHSRITRTGMTLGTVGYMAPE